MRTTLPDPLPKLHEQQRHGHKRQRNEPQHGVPPAIPQGAEQRRPGQRQKRRRRVAGDEHRAHGADGVDAERVDDVALQRDGGGGEGEADDGGAEDGHDELHAVRRRPAEEEQAAGHEQAGDEDGRETLLGRDGARSLLRPLDVVVEEEAAQDAPGHEAQAQPQEGQARRALRKAVDVLEDRGDGGHDQVGVPVHDADVQRDQHQRRGPDQEMQRPDGGFVQLPQSSVIRLIPGSEGVVAGFTLLASGFLCQDRDLVGFTIHGQKEQRQKAVCDGRQPKSPPPPGVLAQIRAHDGSEERSQGRGHGHDGHGAPSLFLRKQIAHDAGADGRRGGCSAAEKTERDEHTDIGAQGRSDKEGDEEEVGGVEDWTSTVHLREGAPDQRADDLAQLPDGHDQGAVQRVVGVEVGQDLGRDGRCDDG